MARVSYVEPSEAPDETLRLYDAVTATIGRVSNNAKLMGHVPWLYRWLLPLGLVVQRDGFGLLDMRLRSLAILKVSLVNKCAYCVSHNSQLGEAAGVPRAQADALDGDYLGSGEFSDREVAVIRWAEAVAMNSARRDQAAFAALSAHFSEPEIVELTIICAHRSMINRIQEALWNDLEDDSLPKNTRASVSAAALLDYAEGVLTPQLRENADSDVGGGSSAAEGSARDTSAAAHPSTL